MLPPLAASALGHRDQLADGEGSGVDSEVAGEFPDKLPNALSASAMILPVFAFGSMASILLSSAATAALIIACCFWTARLNVYTDPQLLDVAGALEKLPELGLAVEGVGAGLQQSA